MEYSVLFLAVCGMSLVGGSVLAQTGKAKPGQAAAKALPAYGTVHDVGYAKTLWARLRRARLVGDHRFCGQTHEG